MKLQTNINNRAWVFTAVAFAAALLWSHGVLADTPPSGSGIPSVGLLDDMANSYLSAAKTWEEKTRAIANNVFYLGAVISLGWTSICVAVKPKEFDGFLGTIVKQVFTLSFFYLLVQQGTYFSGLIISSFQQAGMEASGWAQALSPSSIVEIGFDCLFRIFSVIGNMGWGDTAAFGLPLALAGICILLCFAVVAIQFLLVIIEAYFVMYGGIIMLGFGALPWTRDIPKNYLVYAINVGVRLFVLYLVVSVGLTLAKQWPAMVNSGAGSDDVLHNVFYIVVSALVFAAVAWKVPGIAGALTSGAVNMSAADGIGAAAGAVGMAAGAAGLGMAAAKAVGGEAMATVRGAAQAGMAGTDLARGMGASGAGAVVKGLGNAIGAAGQEAGRSMGSSLGLRPQSPNATDTSGSRIGNLGTRAANNLMEKAQATKENMASRPVAAEKATTGGGDVTNSDVRSSAPPSVSAGARNDENATASVHGSTPAAESASDSDSGPVAKPEATPPPIAPIGESTTSENSDVRSIAPPSSGRSASVERSLDRHAAPSREASGKTLGDALGNLRPPAMPHDGGGSGVQVNLHGGHED